MEEKSIKNFKPALINGLILGLILVLYSIILHFTGLTFKNSLQWFSYFMVGIVLFFMTKFFRDKELDGNISYGKALGFSTLVIVFGSLLFAVYYYVFITVIDPEHINNALKYAEQELLQKGTLPDDQIEMAVSLQRKMMKPFIMSISSFFAYTFFCFLLALITSAFVKKEGDSYQKAMKDIQN